MVQILMATYNGAAYLQEQLESLISQTYTQWELIVRDDQSTDETSNILATFAKRDSRIKVMDLQGRHGGAAINFSVLFDYAFDSASEYVMFSDQDDIWMNDKVERSLNFIKELENSSGKGNPTLVYGAFQFIAADGQIIDKDIPMPETLTLKNVISQNHAYGCTMIMNRALVEMVGHIPHEVENHDYWVALVAAAFGKAVFNPRKVIYYRQHGGNVSGTVERSSLKSRVLRYFDNPRVLLPELRIRFQMLNMFWCLHKDRFQARDRKLMVAYLNAFRSSTLKLLMVMITNRIFKLGTMQTIAHYYAIFRLRSEIVKNHSSSSPMCHY